jgi:hypothetical protein
MKAKSSLDVTFVALSTLLLHCHAHYTDQWAVQVPIFRNLRFGRKVCGQFS